MERQILHGFKFISLDLDYYYLTLKKDSVFQMKACRLKDPSQPPPFSMPSKLFTLFGEAKSYCFSVSCVPEGMFNYL